VRYDTPKAPVEREVLRNIVDGLVWVLAAEIAKPASHFATAQE
jgi:hypothetical protein